VLLGLRGLFWCSFPEKAFCNSLAPIVVASFFLMLAVFING
jgi:hypothetical protein